MAYVDKNILAQSQSGNVKIDVQIKALLAKYQNSSTTTRQFWERIKNRLLVEKQVTENNWGLKPLKYPIVRIFYPIMLVLVFLLP